MSRPSLSVKGTVGWPYVVETSLQGQYDKGPFIIIKHSYVRPIYSLCDPILNILFTAQTVNVSAVVNIHEAGQDHVPAGCFEADNR